MSSETVMGPDLTRSEALDRLVREDIQLRIEALRLAHRADLNGEEVVARAKAYYNFLFGQEVSK